MGNRRFGNPVLRDSNGKITMPKRIPFTEKLFDEGWIQELIRANPELLPVEDIEPVFAPLISIGMEVPTEAGSIDNLYLSPQGYLTIVETKLWRNPEARREVVGQIIDYAKDLNRWTFEKLDSQVRAYNEKYRGSSFGVIDTLRLVDQIDEADEKIVVDNISRNLRRGRFLLLIVGDGIRESVEEMADFLNQTPQLYFTLALVELQVYQPDVDDSQSLLVIPQVVARTKEITRAVVRVEGKDIERISIEVDTKIERERQTGHRFTLSEQDFFDALSQKVPLEYGDFAHKIIEDVEKLGCVIEWKQASYVVKLPDPYGSGKNLTLFVVSKDGDIYPGWLSGQLKSIDLSEEISFDFVKKSAALFDGCEVSPKNPDGWTHLVSLKELHQHYDDFMILVEETIGRINEIHDKVNAIMGLK